MASYEDLISRERLKNTILLGNYDTKSKILSAIDNAPTVVPEDFMNPYEEGYERARKDFERPQGEWIIVKDEKWGDNVKCPFCGKELAGTDLNFCCKCGAKLIGSEKMNGGAE